MTLGSLLNENYTMKVIKLTSPDGTKTVTVDAAEKREPGGGWRPPAAAAWRIS